MENVKILVVRPNEEPVVELLSGNYRDIRNVVGGCFQITYHYEPELLVCNDEGKINGSEPNRVVYFDGEPIDVIFGTFFICGEDEDGDFVSLTEEKIQHYKELFALRNAPKDWGAVYSKFLKTEHSSRISSELECEVCLFADHCTGALCLK